MSDPESSSGSPAAAKPLAHLDIDLHVKYIQDLDKQTQSLAYHLTSHLRLNGIYWAICALYTMGREDALDREEMIRWVMSCWDEKSGAFGAHPRHDGHILATLSGIQVLIIQDALDALGTEKTERIIRFILSLVDPTTGSVSGDEWNEIDTRFSYIAIQCLALLNHLDILTDPLHPLLPERLRGQKVKDLIVGYIERCRNFDGGFGGQEGGETHGGQIFTCVAALAILDRLDLVDTDTLAWWLSERQLPNGGLNGRPEKLEDVCYSWWDLTGLAILGKLHWIDRRKLADFILEAQDLDGGGIADRPGDWVDVFHTHFGVAGLRPIDPVYCLPADITKRLGLQKYYQVLPSLA